MSKKKCTDGRKNNRPPKNRQFGQPGGNSRNTYGRPPGRNVIEFDRLSEEALWDCFLQAAQMPVGITEDGNDLLVPYIMALAKRMAQDAIKGDRHARKDLLRMLEKATKGTDKMRIDLCIALADREERRIKAMVKPGSLEFFNAKYEHYMSRKHLRRITDGPEFIYVPGEPILDEDWAVFMEQYELVKASPSLVLPWPLKYPSDDME